MSSWEYQSAAMKLLYAVLQHGAVFFAQDVFPHVYSVVSINAKNILVIGGMVYLAQRQAVLYYRDAPIITVGDDMCSVQQFRMV